MELRLREIRLSLEPGFCPLSANQINAAGSRFGTSEETPAARGFGTSSTGPRMARGSPAACGTAHLQRSCSTEGGPFCPDPQRGAAKTMGRVYGVRRTCSQRVMSYFTPLCQPFCPVSIMGQQPAAGIHTQFWSGLLGPCFGKEKCLGDTPAHWPCL